MQESALSHHTAINGYMCLAGGVRSRLCTPIYAGAWSKNKEKKKLK